MQEVAGTSPATLALNESEQQARPFAPLLQRLQDEPTSAWR